MTAPTKVGFAWATIQGLCSIIPFLGLAASIGLLGLFLDGTAIDLGVLESWLVAAGPLLGSLLAAAISFVSYKNLVKWIVGSPAKPMVWILMSILTSGPFWGGLFGMFLMSMVVRNLAVQILLLMLSIVGIWAVLVAVAGTVGAILCKADLASQLGSRQQEANEVKRRGAGHAEEDTGEE